MKNLLFKTIIICLVLVNLGFNCLAQEPVYPEGKRFPLGLYSVNLNDPQVVKSGWNIAQSYQFSRDKKGFIMSCAKAGLLTMATAPGIDASETEISKYISECISVGNISWWNLPEEVKWYAPEKFDSLRRLITLTRKYDTHKYPVYMYLAGDFGVEDLSHYIENLDIISASIYCNFKAKPHPFARWIVESRIEAIQQEGYRIGPDYRNGEKTVCAILELFDITKWGDTLNFPKHAYHDFWSALACGAQGIMVYSYAHMNRNPHLPTYWQEYCKAASRLTGEEQLDQMILFGKKLNGVTASVTSGPQRTPKFVPRVNALSPTPPSDKEMDYPSVNILTKTWNKSIYIIAVNSADGGVTTEITGLPKDISVATVLFENRQLKLSNGIIRDTISSYGVHIYKMDTGSKIPETKSPGPITFRHVTSAVGLNEGLKGMNAHSAAWGDINNDGFPDLFVGTFASHPGKDYNFRGHGAFPEPDKLFINNKGISFTEVTNSPTEIKGMSSGAAFADFDNDGYLDLISSHLATKRNQNPVFTRPNYLFHNDGTGKMIDVSAKSNLVFNSDSIPCSARNTFVFDYDGDGMIDLLMQDDDAWPWSIGKSHLMRNIGNMIFEDVTVKAGLPEFFYGLGGFVGDINNDTWPDIYFAQTNVMYINNKNGTFHKLDYQFFDPQYSVNARGGNKDWTCGADLGDLNGDGLLDIVVGDHLYEAKTLKHKLHVYINMGNNKAGDPQFEEVSEKIGIKVSDQKLPHIAIEDFDNDGDMDILSSTKNHFIYTNQGVGSNGLPRFMGPTVSNAPDGGLDYWPAGPTADFNRDGRLDFIGAQWSASLTSPLLENITEGATDYIAIGMNIPSEKNRNGIGATVRIYKSGMAGKKGAMLGIKVISISNGYSSGTPAEVHFGTPGLENVDLILTMPCDGNTYIISSVKTRQLVAITGKEPEILIKKEYKFK